MRFGFVFGPWRRTRNHLTTRSSLHPRRQKPPRSIRDCRCNGHVCLPQRAGVEVTFQLAGLPDNAIIDVRDAGRSVFDEGLSIGTVSSGLVEVIVNLGNEAVGGAVYGIDQKPVPGARVVLAPPQGRRHNSVLYKTITTDASGRFTFTRVIPGEYKVFAWQAPPPRNAYLNAAFLSRYETGGRAVQVTSGGRPDLQIPAIPEGR